MVAALSLKIDVRGDNWRTKWDAIQRRFSELTQPRNETMGKESLTNAQNDFHDYFVSSSHLRDALIKEKPGHLHGMLDEDAGKAVRDQIKASPPLSLLADICNVIKHVELDKPPWTGHVPKISAVIGIAQKDGSWLPSLTIEHAGQQKDGISVAEAALSGWKGVLTKWGLI